MDPKCLRDKGCLQLERSATVCCSDPPVSKSLLNHPSDLIVEPTSARGCLDDLGDAPEGVAREVAAIGLLADPEDHSLHRLRLECCAGDIDAIDDAWADTSKRLGNRAADLRPLRRRLIGMAAFVEREEMAGT